MLNPNLHLIKMFQGGNDDLLGEGKRSSTGPRCYRSVIRTIRNTARNVIEKDALSPFNRQLCRPRPLASGQAPANFAIAFKFLRIVPRIRPLDISCPAAILEII